MSDILIEYDAEVPMSDGTILRADVYRPGTGQGPWPVVVQRTPYGKREPVSMTFIDVLSVVAHGYIVVLQDTRGRFASEGTWKPWDFEVSDGRDTVEWAAKIPGSNGLVGMFGMSYTGSTQWTAAISGAPALRAITPAMTWSEPMDGLHQRGGATELGLNAVWTLITGASHLPRLHSGMELGAAFHSLFADFDGLRDRGYWELPTGKLPLIDRYGGPDIGTQAAVADPGADFPHRVRGKHHDIAVPSLTVAGWYDVFLQGTLDNHVDNLAAGNTAKLVIGPWQHTGLNTSGTGVTGEVSYGLSAAPTAMFGTSLTDLEVRWFDHWLKDRDTGILEEPPVKIFVMGTNVWRDENEWPLSRAVDTPWFLQPGGGLATNEPAPELGETPDDYTYDPADPVITRGGNLLMSPEFPAGPFDQAAAEARDDVLVYTSEPLTTDLEVTGRIRMRLYAATDAPSTDWVVRLCDVDEKGVSRNLADGIIRIQAEPDSVGAYDIDLWSTSNVFLAGHRIRVHVTSSNFPRWDRNPNTGEPAHEATTFRTAHQRIFRDHVRPSHIVLPVIPQGPGLGDSAVID
ncbi:CocE/NonD family hydrolase [Streptomyces sp. NPDC007162]|uniref:CocE/NonD family hydrolase n=1 Tax=Streptomyces sp. NPDC007162 TaxID=3156917 RepID=UPI0033C140B0